MDSVDRSIRRLLSAIEELRKVDPEMPTQTAATFLTVALEPGITVKGVQDKLGLALSSASRNVGMLSTRPARRPGREKPGYGLIDYQQDPLDYRRKEIRLTKQGVRLMNVLAETMKGAA